MTDEDGTQTGVPEGQAEGAPAPTEAAITEALGAEGDDYDDVLYQALRAIVGEDGDGEPGSESPVSSDGSPQKPVEEMTLDELKAAFAGQKETIGALAKATLMAREEQNAMAVWNEFFEGATPLEQEIAKRTEFEVDDKAGMLSQIAKIKAQAEVVGTLVEQEVAKRGDETAGALKKKYGILTPDPSKEALVSTEKDKEDLKAGKFGDVISRRFAKARQQ